MKSFNVLPCDSFVSVSNHLLIACQDDSDCTEPTKPHCILGVCSGNTKYRNHKRTNIEKTVFLCFFFHLLALSLPLL